jgi:prolyl-tRNA synthetase
MTTSFEKKQLVKKSANLADWYTDVILKAGLADYAPVKGCMVIRPYGYAIWENMQAVLDKEIKKAGVENAYFPVFIPYSYLEKEKEHVKGFSPELAIVTVGGGEKLKEKLVVRPTSETVMYAMFSRWIQSWRDLPLKINQWCNIVRWEKRTYLFLRTTEFLWQEGHTAHATHTGSIEEAERAIHMYTSFLNDYLALPGLVLKKSEFDKFPGAVSTYAYEALTPSGKALQVCTSHDLGQNFAKPFGVQFQDENGKSQFVWQTSWGLSTRTIGALVLMHGDDQGLVLPPKIAPIQVVIIPIYKNQKEKVLKVCQEIYDKLSDQNIRVKIDSREGHTLGYKINDWELKGVPLRLEIGEKEIAASKIKAVKRIGDNSQSYLSLSKVAIEVKKILSQIQVQLYQKAQQFLKENIREANKQEEFKAIMKSKKGFVKAFWCEQKECEDKIKVGTKAATRGLPLDAKPEKGVCVWCGRPASHRWIFAQAY